MQIGIVSDTHIPRRAKELPISLLKGLEGMDLILHAGDIMIPEVLQQLSSVAPVEAVLGNLDPPQLFPHLHLKSILTFNGCRVGLIHGHGQGKTTMKRAQQGFQGVELDCIVFGHSHIPICEKIDDVLYVNPGSPTDKRRQSHYSYAKLYVEEDIKGELVFL